MTKKATPWVFMNEKTKLFYNKSWEKFKFN